MILALLPASAAALIQLGGPALQAGVLAGSATVPLERAQGGDTPVLTFRTASGNTTVRLLLDTGASSSLVAPALLERLALASRPIPPEAFSLAGAGEGCGNLQPRRARLPALTLGPGITLRDAEVLVLPVGGLPAGVDGVLGAPQLRQLPVWVDPRRGQVAFGAAALERSGPGSSGAEAAPTTHRLRWSRGVPLLALPLGPGLTPALADTGAEGLFVTPRLAAALPAVGPTRPLQVAGFCGLQPAAAATVIGPRLDGAVRPVTAIVTANPVFASLGVEAILGQELLRHHRQLWRLDASPPLLRLWPGPVDSP